MLSSLAGSVRSLYNRCRYIWSPVYFDSSSSIEKGAYIQCNGGGRVVIGQRCEIHKNSMIMTYGGDIIIGDDSSVNPFTILYGHGGLEIGKGVRIAANSTFIPANHIPGNDEVPLFKQGIRHRGIKIGDYCWIGAGCRILDGVTLGANVIVGAGSVVTKSFPDGCVIGGVPARLLNRDSDTDE